MLGYNNLLVELRKQLEAKSERGIQEETDVDERAHVLVGRSLESRQIHMYLHKFTYLSFTDCCIGHVKTFSVGLWNVPNNVRVNPLVL